MKTEINNEQLILEAAEIEFIDKGYKNAATTAIAQRAGVTHAMLHYYYRTKEKLFQKVFQQKVNWIGDSLYQNISNDISFEESIRKLIEFHFDFIRQNPKILNFVYNEVIINEENRSFLLDQLRPKMFHVITRLHELLKKEIAKGTVRKIKVHDLLINMASVNIATFMALPIISDLVNMHNSEKLDHFIDERKESNVQFILNAIKIN